MFIKELKEELEMLGVHVRNAYQSDKIGLVPHQQFTCGKDVPASELAHKIREYASTIQFVPVQLPATVVEFSCLYRIGDIFVRYLEMQSFDEVEGQYDVIVVKY